MNITKKEWEITESMDEDNPQKKTSPKREMYLGFQTFKWIS